MANNKKKKNDEQRVAQINAHKEAAKKISQKPASTSSSSKPIQVNSATKKVQQTYGGIPVNTTKSMGSVKNGAAYYRDVAKYTTDSRKWYSGTTPTARETVARIYEVSNGDSARFNELMALYDTERNNRGSTFYNPYAQATNYKEIEALQAAGIDVSGGITAEWFKENQWLRNYARTNTGYGALAPSSKSSDLENAAWAYENLLDAETRTVKAEAELAAMANEAKYWAGLGYSDSEIVKKLKNNSDYGTLWKMDEERQQGGASLLNRAIDYNGDDTMYGMIWAARNEGTGDYFTDSVKYTLGQGNKYKSDPYSEAARDPSNYEGYHPYILGGTRHDKNQKYGITGVDQQWLDDHRDWLNDPEKADDWRAYEKDLEFTQKAETELTALNQWLDGKIEKLDGTEDSYNDLVEELTALITDGEEIPYTYVDEKGETKRTTIKLTNLSKMEDARASGLAENIAYAIDFTLPSYLDKVNDAYEAKVAAVAAEEAVQPEQKRNYDLSAALNSVPGIIFTGGLGALVPSNLGKENKDFTKSLDKALKGARKSHTNLTDTDYANIYLRSEYGVELAEGAELTEDEAAAVKEFAKQYGESKTFKGSKADKDEAVAALEAMGTAFAGLIADEKRVIAYDPEAKANAAKLAEEEAARIAEEEAAAEAERKANAYKDSAAYATILGADGQKEQQKRQEDAYARGMVEGEFVPQSHVRDAGVPSGGLPQPEVASLTGEAVPFDAVAYESMLSGDGEWNSELFAQALSLSSDRNAVLGELYDGIIAQMRGEDGNALSQSWMKKFGGITRNTEAVYTYNWQTQNQQDDSRSLYGTRIKNAILANEEALKVGVITPQEYVSNMVGISVAVDAVGKPKRENFINFRKVEKNAEEILNANGGALGAGVDAITEKCNAVLAEHEQKVAAEEEAYRNIVVSARDSSYAGKSFSELSKEEQDAVKTVMSADILPIKRNDKGYKKRLTIIDSYGFDEESYAAMEAQGTAPTSVSATDVARSHGIAMAAEDILEEDMRYAVALGMSLDEYYEAYPEYAKSADQIIERATEAYDSAWSEFNNSPEGIRLINEFLETGVMPGQETMVDSNSPVRTPEYDMTAFDVFREATGIWSAQLDQNLAKTAYLLAYDIGDAGVKTGKVTSKYGSDPKALARAWEDVLSDERIPEETRAEYQAKFDTAVNIFDLGDPEAVRKQAEIVEGDRITQGYRDTVKLNGTALENTACDFIVSIEDMAWMFAIAGVGNLFNVGSAFTSAIAMVPSELAGAHDNVRAGADPELAIVAALASLAVQAKIEQLSIDSYMFPKASKWDDAILRADYSLGKKKLFKAMRSPADFAVYAKFVGANGAKALMHGLGEYGEEFTQELTDSAETNLVTGKGYLWSEQDVIGANKAGFSGLLLGMVADGAMPNANTEAVDYIGNEVRSAEGALGTNPAYEGTLINEAIDFEATVAAIQTSGEQLAALQESPENKAVQQAEEALEAAEQEVADIDVEIETATAEQTDAAAAVENANAQIQQAEVCTEEMASQMEAAAKALEDSNSKVAALQKKKAAAEVKVAEQRALLDEKRTVVQARYREIMDAAKAKAEQEIADKYYNGSTEEQKAASEEYRAACKKLADAKRALQVQKARRKNGIDVQRGRTLLAIDRLTAEVEAAKAEVDEAFANTPESAEEIAQREELEAVTQEAQQTAADAEANPADTKKQAAALFSQARLEAVQAKQNLEKTKANVRERLYNKNAIVRAQAVAEWQAAQESADAAAQAAQDAEALYNESDTQKQLREAIDEAKQYTNEQLLFDDVEGHADAVAAYSRVRLAKEALNKETKRIAAEKTEIGTPEHEEAMAEYAAAIESEEDEIARQLGTTGDNMRAEFRRKSVAAQALEAAKAKDQAKTAKLIKQVMARGGDSAAASMKDMANLANGVEATADNIAGSIAEQLVKNNGNAPKISGYLNAMANAMWGDYSTAAKTGEQTKADQSPIEIMRNIAKRIGVGFHAGANMSEGGMQMPKAVQGFYNKYVNAIRTATTAASDLANGLHEIGHAVQNRLGDLHATESMKSALSTEVKRTYGNDPILLDGEAVAEFVVQYLFSRDAAIKSAGLEFVQQFEDMVGKDKALHKALQDASQQIMLWNNATLESKAQAQQKMYMARRSEIGSQLSRFVRGIETGIFDMTAPAKLVSKDFHQKALYSLHASNRADVVLSQKLIDPDGNYVGASLAEALLDAGVNKSNFQRVITYQLLKHHLARMAEGKPVFDPVEYNETAVKAELARMESEVDGIAAGGQAFTNWWNSFVDTWLVDTGIIDKKDVEAMRAKYENYLPTFRVQDVDVNAFGGNQSKFQIYGAKKGGSSLDIINPLYSIATQVQKVVKYVTHNQLMQAFDKEYLRGGLGEIAIDVTEKQNEIRTDTTKAMELVNELKGKFGADSEAFDKLINELDRMKSRFQASGEGVGKNVVSVVRQDGSVAYYQIKDTSLFNVLSANQTSMNKGLRAAAGLKNIITALTTGSNPLFAIKNMIRDYQASVNTGTWAVTYADGIVRWVRAFCEVAGQSEAFKEWQAMGGGEHTRMSAAWDDNAMKSVQKQLTQLLLQGKHTKNGEFKASKNALQFMEGMLTAKDINNIIEATSRFVEYRFGKHDLTTAEGRQEAFMASQDVTTNFGTHGSWEFVNTLRQVTPFMNATLQGIHKDAQIVADLFSKDKATRRKAVPKVAKVALNSMLMAGFQWAILALFKKGDKDDEEYALLNDSMKAGNLIIPMNDELFTFLRDKYGFNKPYWRIPIGQGWLHQSMYAASVEAMGNVAGYSPFEMDTLDTVWSILKDSMPNTATVLQGYLDV